MLASLWQKQKRGHGSAANSLRIGYNGSTITGLRVGYAGRGSAGQDDLKFTAFGAEQFNSNIEVSRLAFNEGLTEP